MNSTGCPLIVLYIKPSIPCPKVTVDILEYALIWLATWPKLVIFSSNWFSARNLNVSCTRGSSCHFNEFSSSNRLDICLRMFKISTSFPFSKAFSVNSTLLCTLPKAASSSSCWISKDFCFTFFISLTSWINSSQRAFRRADNFRKQLSTSWTVWSAFKSTLLLISETPSIAFFSDPACPFVFERISTMIFLFFAKASFTKV